LNDKGKPMTRTAPPDLLQGTLDMMILKTLSTGANHGYGIARRIHQTSDQVLQVEEGSLYPALHRLEQRGCLTAHWERSESNRRAKFYTLTTRGRRQLGRELKRWDLLSTAVSSVLAHATPRKAQA
jgi:PadR family transcriptional regulator PadR